VWLVGAAVLSELSGIEQPAYRDNDAD